MDSATWNMAWWLLFLVAFHLSGALPLFAQNWHLKRPRSGKQQLEKSVSVTQYCASCCNDGDDFTACLDIQSCANRLSKDGKYAFILSHFGKPNVRFKFLPFISSMRAQVLANPGVHIDILLLMTETDSEYLKPEHHKLLADNHIKMINVEWNLPPGMVYKGESKHNHYRSDNSDWCGPQDLMRLHAFNLTKYDAVAYYDSDMEFQGDVMPVFRCAATGRFLTTGGGLGVPLNIGFFAMHPDPRMLRAAEYFAKSYNYSYYTGWGDSGWSPAKAKYAGGECGQGFIHTLFYMKKSKAAQVSLEVAGLGAPGAVQAYQIDRCVWNYQTDFQCPHDFNCSLVRVHHKPKKPGPNSKECLKRYQQKQRKISA